jgi:hypothetical protein
MSPWPVLEGVVSTRCTGVATREARAFLQQALDFYTASARGQVRSNPLLLYYAFLNLAKTFALTSGRASTVVEAKHGIAEDRQPGSEELGGAELVIVDDPRWLNVFPLLVRSMGYTPPPNGTRYRVLDLLPQVVIGHRLWREAGGSERYVPVSTLFHHDPQARQMWLTLYVKKDDLSRFGITRNRVLREGGLASAFREVRDPILSGVPNYVCFEQTTPLSYGDRPSDQIADLAGLVRPFLWRSATSVPPYRNYYIQLDPLPGPRLPQLATLYALFFYFGSITRYRPHVFDDVLQSSYGPFVSEFVSAQPEQLLYLLTSEMREREVAKPALI